MFIYGGPLVLTVRTLLVRGHLVNMNKSWSPKSFLDEKGCDVDKYFFVFNANFFVAYIISSTFR